MGRLRKGPTRRLVVDARGKTTADGEIHESIGFANCQIRLFIYSPSGRSGGSAAVSTGGAPTGGRQRRGRCWTGGCRSYQSTRLQLWTEVVSCSPRRGGVAQALGPICKIPHSYEYT